MALGIQFEQSHPALSTVFLAALGVIDKGTLTGLKQLAHEPPAIPAEANTEAPTALED